jgi:hypothetical protein
LNLCDHLFAAETEEHAACVKAVEEINPGCGADIAEPAIESGD